MIGGRMHDMIAARTHDALAVGVLWGYGSEEELRTAGAQRIVSEPREIALALG